MQSQFGRSVGRSIRLLDNADRNARAVKVKFGCCNRTPVLVLPCTQIATVERR